MTREEHFAQLVSTARAEELPPALSQAIARGLRRGRARRARRVACKCVCVMAAALVSLFVVGVNTSAGIASALSGIPVLGGVAALVQFNKSLSMAVGHNMLQNVGAQATNAGITFEVGDMLIDETGFTLFYRFVDAGGQPVNVHMAEMSLSMDGVPYQGEKSIVQLGGSEEYERMDVQLGELTAVPDLLQLSLRAFAPLGPVAAEREPPEVMPGSWDVALRIDPGKVGLASSYEAGQTFQAGGLTFQVTDIVVVPTRAIVRMQALPGPEAERFQGLQDVALWVDGAPYSQDQDGICSAHTYSPEEGLRLSYNAPSPYYERPGRKLSLHVGKALFTTPLRPFTVQGLGPTSEEGVAVLETALDAGDIALSLPVGREIGVDHDYTDAQGVLHGLLGSSAESLFDDAGNQTGLRLTLRLPAAPGPMPYVFSMQETYAVPVNVTLSLVPTP